MISPREVAVPAELLVAHRALDAFLGQAVGVVASNQDPVRRIQLLLDPFRHLLMEDFLPTAYKAAPADGFLQYLVYRSSDRSLSVMAMVVAPRAATPVHDHLAWGLVGVYQGMQQETVYRRLDDGSQAGHARLATVQRQRLRAGDVTALVPPDGDVHRIETVSDEPSVSLHVLGNDIGCQLRHAFDVEARTVRDFRSGYANASCEAASRVNGRGGQDARSGALP